MAANIAPQSDQPRCLISGRVKPPVRTGHVRGPHHLIFQSADSVFLAPRRVATPPRPSDRDRAHQAFVNPHKRKEGRTSSAA